MSKNIEKLEKYARDRYDYALLCDPGSEDGKQAFEEGLKAQQMANDMKKMEPNKDERFFAIGMAVLTGLLMPLAIETCKYHQRRTLTKDLCKWENDGNILTSTPGKAVSSLFRW